MISESERKGLAEGSRQTKLETAKTMLTMGYPLGDICKIVGLPQAEVEALK
jgi:transposase (fragment)